MLKETLRELLGCVPSGLIKGIRLVVFETGASGLKEPGRTTRYLYKDGQATVHVELDSILRMAGGLALNWRVWNLGRRSAHALSFALAHHALRGRQYTSDDVKIEAGRIQLTLVRSWSQRWAERINLPAFAKRILLRLVGYRLAIMARNRAVKP